ncbi:DUF4177 domain-containing protein [Paucisalibacillus globulus]|uniref:DUF4177 domain-containing protein n=1 Tax=Paucisalibacillus globulus TaxID=351095 RepID=UPI001C3F0658|nr:DUF4177 domain-containing protein [Paucisalibacillus globulus]
MNNWEYMVENWTIPIDTTNREEFETELNEYGKDGWELVTIIPKLGVIDELQVVSQLIFKRKIEVEL